MLIPYNDGSYYYHDVKLRDYRAFVNSQLQIVEDIFTDDGERIVRKYDWDDLNDIEKYVVLQRGWDIPSAMDRRKAEELEKPHEAVIIPFPLSS